MGENVVRPRSRFSFESLNLESVRKSSCIKRTVKKVEAVKAKRIVEEGKSMAT